MKRKLGLAIAAGTAAATLGLGAVGTASAAPNAKGACVQAGIGTLKGAGLFQQAAKKQVDYGSLVPGLPGPGTPLGQVIKAHTTNPELFPWCD